MTSTTGRRGALERVPRGVVVGLGVAVAVLLAAYAGGRPGRDGPPLDPRSDGPLGTSALVTLLERLGADVSLSVGLPGADDDVALLLQDRLDDDQADELAAWVGAGGILVVTDPASPFAPPVMTAGLLPDTTTIEADDGSCSVPALAAVAEVDAGAAVRYGTSSADATCFDEGDDGAFVVVRAHGAGEVVAVGGAAFATNDRLDEHDNAVLAVALLAPSPGTRVRFVTPPVPAGGGTETLDDLVPDGLKRALAQLAVAFVLYALWRAIRLGRPVGEAQKVELDSSELVAATGRLLARTRSPAAAADMLREDLRRSLRARFGVPPGADVRTLAEVVAARSGIDPAPVLAAIDERPVDDDATLVAVARAVSSIHQEVLR